MSKPEAARINLEILLQAPVVLLPRNSKSTEVLLVYLGNLTVRNSLGQALVPALHSSAETDGDLEAFPRQLRRSPGIDQTESSLHIPIDKITVKMTDFVLFR